MSRVILACDAMLLHIDAAQETCHTHYPIIKIDRRLHAEPSKLRLALIDELAQIPSEVDTVLVAMGFCGGAWEGVQIKQRTVIPRVDDCITLLLHTDDTWHANLKQCGHMYFRDRDVDDYFHIAHMRQRLLERYGEKKGLRMFKAWFVSYTHADIIDTGTYDCHNPAYVQDVQQQAQLIHSELNFVPGSNLLLEKLVAGQWDSQFVVAQPGQVLSNDLFV